MIDRLQAKGSALLASGLGCGTKSMRLRKRTQTNLLGFSVAEGRWRVRDTTLPAAAIAAFRLSTRSEPMGDMMLASLSLLTVSFEVYSSYVAC